ncbi:hypothetical protein C8035_v006588 [Colletotrichum spinosum]|uniref:Uncharacterized protein n=1 Tax=Colletotrichum spinosum TaxID=1347390 RepID=A0A4R8QNL7_9PEZI|nr:hypothetical protein C8035_v006588 [Colletotrichum spinosum]
MATAFFLVRRAEAETKNYCANLDNKVVDYANCNGKQPANTFFMFASDDPSMAPGTVIDPTRVDLFDSSDPVERQNILLPLEIESHGFGRRQVCGKGGISVGSAAGAAAVAAIFGGGFGVIAGG